jgi:hypothetical protein
VAHLERRLPDRARRHIAVPRALLILSWPAPLLVRSQRRYGAAPNSDRNRLRTRRRMPKLVGWRPTNA